MLCGPEVPHLPCTPDRMEAGFTVCEVGGHQLQQILLAQTGQQGGDVSALAEAQFYREKSGGAVVRLFDEQGGCHGVTSRA